MRINNFPNLEAIGPNRTFIHPVSDDKADEFSVDIPSISSKSSVAFTYRVHIDETNTISQAPILVKPVWKPVVSNNLQFFIDYSLNPAYSSAPTKFHSLMVIAHYTGPRAIGCQTKPSGTHRKEHSFVGWQLAGTNLTSNWNKLVCRLVGSEGNVPEPGYIEVRWEIQGSSGLALGSGISLSRLESIKGKEKEESEADPFADESIVSPTAATPSGNWVQVETSKKLTGGKYEAR